MPFSNTYCGNLAVCSTKLGPQRHQEIHEDSAKPWPSCSALPGLLLHWRSSRHLVDSGLDRLRPVKVLIFAASAFGLIAALLDWALFRTGGTMCRWFERRLRG